MPWVLLICKLKPRELRRWRCHGRVRNLFNLTLSTQTDSPIHMDNSE